MAWVDIADVFEDTRPLEKEGTCEPLWQPWMSHSAANYRTLSGRMKDLSDVRHVHKLFLRSGREMELPTGNFLVSMYSKYGSPHEAHLVFRRMRQRNLYSWNAIISAFAYSGHVKESLNFLHQMLRNRSKLNRFSIFPIVGACASQGCVAEGKLIHACSVSTGLEREDIFLETSLVNMYGKCGRLKDAEAFFKKMHEKNVVAWSSIVAACARNGHSKEALEFMRQMEVEGVKPNQITLISVLDACASLAWIEKGKLAHAQTIASGYQLNIVGETALISMYGKCGSLDQARQLFDKMQRHDLISWTAIIAVHAQNGYGKEALEIFRRMDLEGPKPNRVTFLSILDACASNASLVKGRLVHARIVANGFEVDTFVKNALVDMYAKCGRLKEARHVFSNTDHRDVTSWNTMIAAYARYGHGRDAIEMFRKMRLDGIKPDAITFLSILHACNHAGLLDEGRHYFTSMTRDHAITPVLDHYGCMIDLLGRAGQLVEAENLIKDMHIEPKAVTWVTLLGACRIHGDVERGARAAQHVFRLDPENTAPFVLLSNIYAAAGRWDDAARVRKAMTDKGLKKEPGRSWIEINEKVHTFIAGDKGHCRSEEIYSELERLGHEIQAIGYVADTKAVLHDVAEEEKGHLLSHHSEKLAVAFGLIATAPGTPLHIFKNIRMCSDCHAAIKFISNSVNREIIVRDGNRFHHFQNGVCSCGDYW